jgi:hypothetical protein
MSLTDQKYKEKNSMLKIAVWLQTESGAETYLTEGLTCGRWRTSKAEKTDLVGTCKLTVSKKRDQLSFVLKTIMTIKHQLIAVWSEFWKFFIIIGVGLSLLGTAATSGLLYKPQMIDEGDCGAIGGMKTGRGDRSTQRKPAPTPLCPPQIPHD